MSGQTRRTGRIVVFAVFAGWIFGTTPTAALIAQALVRNETVIAGADGTGVTSASFPTTFEGEAVHYLMLIENGFNNRPPVEVLQVTLNGEVVFQNEVLGTFEKIEVEPLPSGGGLNQLTIEAHGPHGSGARVKILALQRPVQRYGGRSIVPWASTASRTTLSFHNAGPSPMAARVNFYNADGSLAGRTAPILMTRHDTVKNSIGNIVAQQGIQWTAGPVEIEWVSPGEAQMTAVAEACAVIDCEGYTHMAGTALDDYVGPISAAQFEALWGQLPPD
jgi:hypothetical protein